MVCSHITYEIATGVFQPDTKLPTVRDAVVRWSVDHRIVLKAYKRLEQLGLVRSVPREGGDDAELGAGADSVVEERLRPVIRVRPRPQVREEV